MSNNNALDAINKKLKNSRSTIYTKNAHNKYTNCTQTCDTSYLRLSEDVASVPKHVGVFKTYVQFINPLSAFSGIYYCKNNARK